MGAAMRGRYFSVTLTCASKLRDPRRFEIAGAAQGVFVLQTMAVLSDVIIWGVASELESIRDAL